MGRRGRLLRLVLVGLVVVGLAVGTAGFVHSQTGDTVKAPVHDPDLDLPFAEREAKYQADWNEFVQRLEAWVASVDTANVNYEALRHAESLRHGMDPEESLDEAAAAAKWVVVVRVESIRLTAMSGNTITLHVERTLKGPRRDRIEVLQGSGLYPEPDWETVIIVDDPGDPLLLPGHRYLLFLQEDRRFPPYVQSFSGWYELKDGTVHALEFNPFGSEVDGLLERDFVRLVEASVRRAGGR